MKIVKEITTSSAISAFEYDTETMVLQIRFMSGRTYDYPNVPESIVVDWMNSESMGKFFNANIRSLGA